MTEEDFRALIILVEEQLKQIGADDVADAKHYVVEADDGEFVLLDPFSRLVAMLEALDRKMATQDRQTYEAAMAQLNQATRGDAPHGGPYAAFVEFPRDESSEAVKVDLGDAPSLREVRMMLRRLVGELNESRPFRGESA